MPRKKPNLETILKKSRPTGEDVGRAWLMNLCYENRINYEGQTFQPLFSAKKLQHMQDRFTKENDFVMYDRYIAIYTWVSKNDLFFIVQNDIITEVYGEMRRRLEEMKISFRFGKYLREKGMSKEEVQAETLDFFGLNYGFNFLSNEAGIEKAAVSTESHHGHIQKAFREMLAYDEAVDLIAEETQVPDFRYFRRELIEALNAEEQYNKEIQDLINIIVADKTLSEPDKNKIYLKPLMTVFKRTDLISTISIAEKNMKKARALLKDLQVFDYNDGRLTDTLIEE